MTHDAQPHSVLNTDEVIHVTNPDDMRTKMITAETKRAATIPNSSSEEVVGFYSGSHSNGGSN